MTRARTPSTSGNIYWGTGGEYGPFEEQQIGEWAGWPDFGKVLRYFRERAKMTIPEFAAIYGKRFHTRKGGRAITERQVLRMELSNQVPTDLTKRKFIVDLLKIPPMLLGIAVLEDVTFQPHPEVATAVTKTGYTTLPKVVADTTKYKNNIRTFWTLHSTSQVQNALDQINADIQDLESLASQARGDLLYHIRELLFSYHILAANVVRDQRNFNLSHRHANLAVRVAKATKDTDLVATALYTRGYTYLEWGMFGTLAQGVFQIQQDKVVNAIRDFEDAKQMPGDGEQGLHPQLLGRIRIHLSRAYIVLKVSNGEPIPVGAITMLNDAAENVEKQNIEDLYQRVLVTGMQEPLTLEGYYNARAATFNVGRMPSAALKEIQAVEALQQGTLGKDFTRRHTWFDIGKAKTFMRLEQFEEATRRAKKALLASKDIKSTTGITNLVDIHGRLLKSPYKDEQDVKELGDMLHEANLLSQAEEQSVQEEDY